MVLVAREETISKLYDAITKGNTIESFEIYTSYLENTNFDESNEIFRQVVKRINTDFESEKSSNATYHVAKNVSETLDKMISHY